MDILKNWNEGSPYAGANAGIDPGQMFYWNEGSPLVNFYESPQTPNLSKVAGVTWSSIGKILNTQRDDILKIINTETYV